LEGYGCEVTIETDSQSGFSKFLEDPQAFDLLVTDQTMPGMTGGELAQAVLTVRSELPVILCSGYSDHMDENKAALLGIRGYVSKPLNTIKFLGLIESLLKA
jgi:CheY-like chemotaxis protein